MVFSCASCRLLISSILLQCSLGSPSLAGDAPFLRDSRIDGTVRLYSFSRDFDRTTRDRRDLALGGRLAFRTGRVQGLQAGATIYTSHNLQSLPDRWSVYGLLAADATGRHANYTVAGEAFLDGRWDSTAVRIGRTELTTPWLNAWDIRMTPISYEALRLGHEAGGWKLEGGTARAVKPRTSERFQPMGEALGVRDQELVWFGGVTWRRDEHLRAQIWHYIANNIWRDWYVQVNADRKLSGDLALFTDLRYLRRRETGRALAGAQGTSMSGGTLGATWRGATLYGACERIGDRLVQRPWGHSLVISEQVESCDQARQHAWLLGLGYDLGRLGLRGLKANVSGSWYTVPAVSTAARQERREIDYDLRFAFGSSWEARVRYAEVRAETNGARAEGARDLRLQLSHSFSLVRGR